jgi:TonB family protein
MLARYFMIGVAVALIGACRPPEPPVPEKEAPPVVKAPPPETTAPPAPAPVPGVDGGVLGLSSEGTELGDEYIGLGNLGTIGHGGGGGYDKTLPRIRFASASVKGALSKEEIRNVHRKHYHEINLCWGEELKNAPSVEGRINIIYVIDSKGNVTSAKVGKGSAGSKAMQTCLKKAFESWKFPPPHGGGVVMVNVPIVLIPPEEDSSASGAGP